MAYTAHMVTGPLLVGQSKDSSTKLAHIDHRLFFFIFFYEFTIMYQFFNWLKEIVDDIDEDGSGMLEFPEFIQLAAKFLIEEDEEQMKWELKEAFRIYDKHGKFKFF